MSPNNVTDHKGLYVRHDAPTIETHSRIRTQVERRGEELSQTEEPCAAIAPAENQSGIFSVVRITVYYPCAAAAKTLLG